MLNYIYTAIVGIAFLSSLLSFRLDYPFHLKVFSILLAITFGVEVYTSYLIKIMHVKNDLWVYNIFMLVEFWAYAFYYSLIIKLAKVKIAIKLFLWLFPFFWFATTFFIFHFKLENWNSYLNIGGSFFTVIWSISYYYQIIVDKKFKNLISHSEFWIATGMLIFYTCQIPFLGSLNFIYENYNSLWFFFYYIFLSLDILMYLIFVYAYLCRVTTKRS